MSIPRLVGQHGDEAPPGAVRRLWATAGKRPSLALVTLAYLVVGAIVLLPLNLGAASAQEPTLAELLGWFAGWVRYDSQWYHEIASDGYFYRVGEQSSVAFFPAYPMLMRAGAHLAGIYLTGVIVTICAGLAAVLLLTRWCAGRMSAGATLTTVLLVLAFPYSLYLYGAVYADALFLASALVAFVLLERGHPWLAGLAGVVATAGRPVGVAVVAGLVIRAVELAVERRAAGQDAAVPRDATASGDHGSTRRVGSALRSGLSVLLASRAGILSQAGVLVSVLGLAGYMAFQWRAFGDPLAFVATESAPGWDQGTGPRALFKLAFWEVMLHGSPTGIIRLLVPAVLLLGAVALLPRIRRSFGWGYTVYTAIAIAIPILGTKDFMGGGRYLLVAFPVFAAVGQLMAEKWPVRWRAVVLGASAVMLVMATVVYGMGVEVS